MTKIHVTGFEYKNGDIHLNISDLILSWKPQKLLNRSFYLEYLKLDGVRVENKNLPENEQNSDHALEQGFVLADINFPLNLILNEISVTDFLLITDPKDKPFLIDALTVRTDVSASSATVNIIQFDVKASEFEISSNGKLKLKADYPVEINSDLQLTLTDLPVVTSKGIIKGDFNTLAIKQSLGGDLQGNVDISLDNPFSGLAWNGKVNIKQIPVRLLDDSIDVKDASFDLSLVGEGDMNMAVLKPLTANLSNGEIILTGQIGWLPQLHWDLMLDTRNIDPAVVYSQWPGDINLKVLSKGRQKIAEQVLKEETSLELQFDLQYLQGTLQGQPLSGKGRFEMQNGLLQLQHLQLSSGEANLNMNGIIHQQLDLKWQIDIPKLTHLVPGMNGSLAGRGKLYGTRMQPVLAGKLNAGRVNYDNINLNQAKLDFSVSPAENYTSHLSLLIDKIISEQNEIHDLLLNIKGTARAHSIGFKSYILENELHLNAKGGYVESENLWRGDINLLTVKGKVPGTWQQKKIAHLVIHPEKANLDNLCLFDQNAFLCTTVQWQPENTQADLWAKNISIARIKPWLPEEITQLSGEINLDARITVQQVLKARLNIDLTPGSISYLLEPDKTVRLKHQQGQIHAVLDEQYLSAGWGLKMSEHGIEGAIKIPRSALETDWENAPVKGHIKLDIKELGLLTALIHEVTDAQGFLKADLQLDGVLAEPVITGVAEFVAEKISIPVTGIEFSKATIKLKGQADKHVEISGQLYSGKRKLQLNGDLSLQADRNWPARLHVQGEEFQIINLPELQVKISPDVNLEHGPDGIKIKGLVNIPEAGIFPNELPEGSKNVSDDTSIVGEKEVQPTNIEMDMTIKLGDKVHLKAFGLNTWLQGYMRIKKSPGQLATANGELRTTQGTFRAYGQNLNIERGRVFYAGGYLDNPGLNIRASKEVQDITVGVMATGTAKNLDISTYSSNPGLNSKDIVSLLLTGQKFDNAANARIYAGRELSDDLSVGVNAGAGDEGSEFVVRYKLRKNMHLEGVSSAQKSGGNIIYTIEFE
ncbi:MAG: translocation/assembly module TamB domain-containing protein [Gammaproteobacteria bacterium]|nr:translocation/assembly module TamB domain-containing protein [Gammaproteobacteria bacterium]